MRSSSLPIQNCRISGPDWDAASFAGSGPPDADLLPGHAGDAAGGDLVGDSVGSGAVWDGVNRTREKAPSAKPGPVIPIKGASRVSRSNRQASADPTSDITRTPNVKPSGEVIQDQVGPVGLEPTTYGVERDSLIERVASSLTCVTATTSGD